MEKSGANWGKTEETNHKPHRLCSVVAHGLPWWKHIGSNNTLTCLNWLGCFECLLPGYLVPRLPGCGSHQVALCFAGIVYLVVKTA